jgi:hypothetical protein
MNTEWKYKEKVSGKSGYRLLVWRSVDATPSDGDFEYIFNKQKLLN